jgi:hypothetical protein
VRASFTPLSRAPRRRAKQGNTYSRFGGDTPRQGATETGESPRYVAQLEKRIDEKDTVIGLLRDELAQRNEEIVRRNERERETNIPIRGLQNLVLQLQPGRTRAADVLDDDPLMRDDEVREGNNQRAVQ